MMLGLMTFLALAIAPIFWVYILCHTIVIYHWERNNLPHSRYSHEDGNSFFALIFLFMTIPFYTHLLLWWGGVK